jgi:hypothetical protein
MGGKVARFIAVRPSSLCYHEFSDLLYCILFITHRMLCTKGRELITIHTLHLFVHPLQVRTNPVEYYALSMAASLDALRSVLSIARPLCLSDLCTLQNELEARLALSVNSVK